MERKIERVCVFDTSCNLNGFNVQPGNILGKITNEYGKELKFFIISPQYNEGCQLVFARACDLLKYGLDALNIRYTNELNTIKHIETAGKLYIPVSLMLDINEWLSILSKENLRTLISKLDDDIASIKNNIHTYEDMLKNTLAYHKIAMDELDSRNME